MAGCVELHTGSREDAGAPVDAGAFLARSTLVEVTGFGTNPGALGMFVYVPATLAPTNLGVVVAMHGCLLSAEAYQAAGWNELAEQRGFLVVYPQTTKSNKCFGWFDQQQNRRDFGEALSLKQMVDWVKAVYGVQRAFVTGLSAGGAMTQLLLATYPDVFSGGASMAGVAYGCSFLCAGMATELTAQQWGDLARSAGPSPAAAAPKVMIWQGTADTVVLDVNAPQSVRQWASVNGISETPSTTRAEGAATVRQYTDSQNQVRVEWWHIEGMGHGTPVAAGCGQPTWYTFDVGLCSSKKAADFFGL